MSGPDGHESGVVETLQSIVIAFVLAMTFRGFVVEAFVIPTGSMAPTLLGTHWLAHSELTGYEYAVGGDRGTFSRQAVADPMVGPDARGIGQRPVQMRPRAGDRILVLKGLYQFAEPKRWDVVVFKNPTAPTGESANYIKRLAGLPNETIWLVDGDVFARPDGEGEFAVQRKPEYVQRALWQPIHHSDFKVARPGAMPAGYVGPPWRGEGWDTSGRSFRTDAAGPTTLAWLVRDRDLNDWTAYNMLSPPLSVPVADLRVAAGFEPDLAELETSLEIEARGHVYEFSIAGGAAHVRYRPVDDPGGWVAEDIGGAGGSAVLPPGRVTNVEFWHVDQSMSIYINGRRAAHLEYDWSPEERLRFAAGDDEVSVAIDALERGAAPQTQVRWNFRGSAVTLHRVSIDRDLHYRSGRLESGQQRNAPVLSGPAHGTHPAALAELGPDHFFMLGDNSQASLDSRLWGSPDPLVAHHVDPAPFVVHRTLLLGKAWVVYWPATYPLTDEGMALVPDFGRLRYIR